MTACRSTAAACVVVVTAERGRTSQETRKRRPTVRVFRASRRLTTPKGLDFPVRQQWSAPCPLLYKSPSWPNNERPIGREAKLRARARSILLMLAVQC